MSSLPRHPLTLHLRARQQPSAALANLTSNMISRRENLTEAAAVRTSQLRRTARRPSIAPPPPPSPPQSLPGQPTCPIHLGAISDDEIVALPCAHILCVECYSLWLRRSNLCPLCRSDMQARDPLAELLDAENDDGDDDDDDNDAYDGPSPLRFSPSPTFSVSSPRLPSPTSTTEGLSLTPSPTLRPLIETLACQHRLIAELELLDSRASNFAGSALNERWKVFLRGEITRLHGCVVGVVGELLA